MRRVATGFLIVFAAVGVAVMTGASGTTTSTGKTYNLQFDNAFGLTSGGDLKVGGVRAGQTTGFNLQKISNGRYVAVVKANVSQSGVAPFRSDASCEIRPQSLIGEYYVDCQPGSSGKLLPNNGVVPVKNTASTIPPDLMQNVMRRPYRERFRLIIAELGTGLAGRPGDLAQVLHRADPGLRETSKVLRMLAQQNQIIKNFITNSDIVVAQLEQKKKEVAHWVKAAGHTAEISATRQAALRQQWQKFPQFLAELRPTMVQLGGLADQQTPLLRQLQVTAPQLKRFFSLLGPFSEASRPSFRSLAKASAIGNKAFRDFNPDLQQLTQLSVHAPSTGKNLRQFLQTMDDPNRASQADARAADSAPPAPDPAAYHKGQGFTGMESLLNYGYWQTLAINPYDQIGHLLRALLNVNSCSAWQTGPVDKSNEALFKSCNSWLGPYQPGVTAPDPTCPKSQPNWACNHIGQGLTATALKTKRGRNGSKPIIPGQAPATVPLPGQINPSLPPVTLPPQIQQLLNQLPTQVPNVGGAIGVPQVDTNKSGIPPLTGVTATTSSNDREQQQLLAFLFSP
jgi:virulence factor Mce-like protein